MLFCEVRGGKFSWIGRIAADPQIRKNFPPQKNTICDRICEKVPFPHILHASKQNDVTIDPVH